MFSSRNIHFAILGLILGATSGYVLAFYQAHTTAAPPAINDNTGSDAAADNAAPEHPDITDEQMIELFEGAIQRNPNQPELMLRYANFLHDLEKHEEAVGWYRKVLAQQPENLDAQTSLGSALSRLGRVDEAMAEFRKTLTANPKHMVSMHNLFMLYTDQKKDYAEAERILRQMEQTDPSYPGLLALRQRLTEQRSGSAQ